MSSWPNQASVLGDLPKDLVADMLDRSSDLAAGLIRDIVSVRQKRHILRDRLSNRIMLDSDIARTPRLPTVAGVDGSYHIDRLLTADFVAIAAVTVEGVIPHTNGDPVQPGPRHFVSMERVAHDAATQHVANAIMFSMEAQLAHSAPYDVVMLDGSLTMLAMACNSAFRYDNPPRLMDWLLNGDHGDRAGKTTGFGPLETTLESYRRILEGTKSDGVVAAVPKYSSNEICAEVGVADFDDKGMLSIVLDPGEYTAPVRTERKKGAALPAAKMPDGMGDLIGAIEDALGGVYTTYYKPRKGFPAVRLEVGEAVAAGKTRFASLLEAVREQSGFPNAMEPYPTFLADKTVRHLSKALAALKNGAVLESAPKWGGDADDVMLAMRGYRT